MNSPIDTGPTPKPRLILYRNEFRWLILTPDGDARSFTLKRDAVRYQQEQRQKFPGQPISLIDTGPWMDSLGKAHWKKD